MIRTILLMSDEGAFLATANARKATLRDGEWRRRLNAARRAQQAAQTA